MTKIFECFGSSGISLLLVKFWGDFDSVLLLLRNFLAICENCFDLHIKFFRQNLQDYQDYLWPFSGRERPNPIACGEYFVFLSTEFIANTQLSGDCTPYQFNAP
jgi:hypothetical protein